CTGAGTGADAGTAPVSRSWCHGSNAPSGFGNEMRTRPLSRANSYSTGLPSASTTRATFAWNGATRSSRTPPRLKLRRSIRGACGTPLRSTTRRPSGIMKCCGVTVPSTRMTTSVRSATGATLSPVTRGSALNKVSRNAMNAVIGLGSFPWWLQLQNLLSAYSEIADGEHDARLTNVDDRCVPDRVSPAQPVLLARDVRHGDDALARIVRDVEDHLQREIAEQDARVRSRERDERVTPCPTRVVEDLALEDELRIGRPARRCRGRLLRLGRRLLRGNGRCGRGQQEQSREPRTLNRSHWPLLHCRFACRCPARCTSPPGTRRAAWAILPRA